jgi:hypothetical protein
MSQLNVQGQQKVQGNLHFGNSGPPVLPSSGAVAAYSLRKLFNSYTGYALIVQRSGDLATQNIGFTNYNVLDVNSIIAFCGSQTGRVVTWYDQSGNGYNIGPGNVTYGVSYPTIYNGTNILQTVNSLPSIYFSGAAEGLVSSAAVPNISFESVFVVEQHAGAFEDKNQRLYSKRRNDLLITYLIPQLTTSYRYIRGGGGLEVGSSDISGITNTINIVEVTAPTTNTADLRRNNVNYVLGSTPGSQQDNSGFAFGIATNIINDPSPVGGNYFSGYIPEFIAYNTNQAPYRQAIYNNIKYAYGVS